MPEVVGTTIILVLGGFYLVFMVWCASGFRRLRRWRVEGGGWRGVGVEGYEGGGVEVSVVIAARDEVGRIEACLRSVLASAEALTHFEVLVVDDGSEDGTEALVASTFASEIENGVVRLLSTGAEGAGKQRALDVGIAAASGRFILTTDADCTVAHGWIDVMVAPLRDGASVVAGPVTCRASDGDSLFARLQELEVTGLVAVGAGSMANGHPTICNSANLGYTTEAHHRWKQQTDTTAVPGADETLVLQAKALTGTDPVFVLNRRALVTAHPVRSAAEFIRQRVRWAAMGSRSPGARVVSISVVVFCFYLSLILAPFLGLWLPWACGLVLKFVADGVLLSTATRFFDRGRLLRLIPIGQVFHAPYIVLAAAYGTVASVRWKDRPTR